MAWLTPLTDEAMNADQQKAFARAKSKLGVEDDAEAPAWLRVLANSPEFLKDVYMNLDRGIFADGKLAAKTKIILAAVAAAHAGHGEVAEFFAHRAVDAGFTWEQVHEALGISATSTSFNHYYKFRSLAGPGSFDGFNPGLRASLFLKPSLGKGFAELVNLVTSSANGCPSCVTGHVASAAEHDVAPAQIDEAIRTGAIVQAICHFLGASRG